jgi:DNA-binding HxlR family transcriptional regulator
VGDRWTLLILRELVLGPAGFAALRAALPGIPTNLLAARLRRLERDGLVARNDAPPRSKAVTYSLTDAGRGLEPVIEAMIRFGTRYMGSGPGGDYVDERWGALALRALLARSDVVSPRGVTEVVVGSVTLQVRIDGGGRTVDVGVARDPQAQVRLSLATALALASGQRDWSRVADVEIDGDHELARAALTPTS